MTAIITATTRQGEQSLRPRAAVFEFILDDLLLVVADPSLANVLEKARGVGFLPIDEVSPMLQGLEDALCSVEGSYRSRKATAGSVEPDFGYLLARVSTSSFLKFTS